MKLFVLDTRSIALFRIALGACVLLDLLSRAVDLRAFATDFGVLPRPLFFRTVNDAGHDGLWSLHAAVGSSAGEAPLFLLAALCACALIVGWRARTFCFATLVLTISLQDRNPFVFYGFDLLLRVCLLWALFLPLGARFSVDAQRLASKPDAVLSAGTAALTLQMFLIYWCSAAQKLAEPSWRDLSAMFLALSNNTHALPLAQWLARFPDVTRALSVLVLAVELLGPLLLLWPRPRVRLATVALFALFHLATACLFTLGLFPLLGVIVWLPFLPSSLWSKAAPRVVVENDATRTLVAALIFVAALAFNIETITGKNNIVPRGARGTLLALHLEQNWNMFTRPLADGWFLAKATEQNGRVVDVLTRGQPFTLDKPASVVDSFPSMRWRKYVTNLARPADRGERAPFARYLCRGFNAAAGHGEHIDAVELIFVREVKRIDGAASSTSPETLVRVSCDQPP